MFTLKMHWKSFCGNLQLSVIKAQLIASEPADCVYVPDCPWHPCAQQITSASNDFSSVLKMLVWGAGKQGVARICEIRI